MHPVRTIVVGVAAGLTIALPVLTTYGALTGPAVTPTAPVVVNAPAVPGAPTTSATPAPAVVVATGPVVRNDYGPVQVEVTLTGDRVTAVRAVALPTGGTSGEISAHAGPVLAQQALDRQGSGVDTVSGATYTSAGYRSSLQAALDAARAQAATTSAGPAS